MRWATTSRPAPSTRTPSPRRRRVLGEDHPHTLTTANNLALNLRALGDYQQAAEVEEWIKRQRR